MHIIATSTLKKFWEKHPNAQTPLEEWIARARVAEWRTPQDVKNTFGANVDFISDNQIIFDIGGNNYRLIIKFMYNLQRAYIKHIVTHKDYDRLKLR
jgi:mRNA interferase HigB